VAGSVCNGSENCVKGGRIYHRLSFFLTSRDLNSNTETFNTLVYVSCRLCV
jgi:hypothetical protein